MSDSSHAIPRLLQIMARLRDPEGGCPWDLKQDYASLVPFTLEEAYEVADAIERGDFDDLRDELGDLLFQVVFYAQLASEQGRFGFDEVAGAIADKLVRRHPHVFGDQAVGDAEEQTRAWERHKAQERAARAEVGAAPGALEGVSLALPALVRAQKLQRRAAAVGFDWDDIVPVADKVEEELQECRAELNQVHRARALHREIGDLLFACVNLARHAGCDAESALRDANAKFERRFRAVERRLHDNGRQADEVTLEELDRLWDAVKADEPVSGAS
jgi:ATP diphosphatase